MSGASRLANNLYKFKKLDFLSTEGANLPECYKNFYREWKMTTPSPVHYIPPAAEWERNPLTGEVKRVPNIPIPVKYVPESHLGIWGGEGVVKGFQKRHPQKARVTHYWVPNLRKSAVYSEILDKTMELTVTSRTIDLIIDNFGFDHYILKTKACDLQSGLALKLKQKMLDALYSKSLYPNDPVKRERVFEKYKNYLEPYSAEDIEWYGLTPDEALVKYKAMEAERSNKGPLKHELRKKYIEYLMKKSTEKEPEEEEKPSTSSSWVSKLNPFASKS